MRKSVYEQKPWKRMAPVSMSVFLCLCAIMSTFFMACASKTIETYRYQTTVKELLNRIDGINDRDSWLAASELSEILAPWDRSWDPVINEMFSTSNIDLMWRLHYFLDLSGNMRFQDRLLGVLHELPYPLIQYNLVLSSRQYSSEIRDIALDILQNRRTQLIPAAIHVLGSYGKRSDLERIMEFRDADNDIIRECILDTLYRYYGYEELEYILSFLNDENPAIVCKTINYISRWNDTRILDHLQRVATYETPARKNALANSDFFSMSEPDSTSQYSTEMFLTGVTPRAMAVFALRDYDQPAALNTLTRVLQDRDVTVREYAALSIGSLGKEIAAPNLLPLLQDTAVSVRRAAVWSLGRLGGDIAVEYLKNIEKFDPDPLVREQARISLREIGQLK